MHAITDFLRGFPPFEGASGELLDAVVASTEIEFFPKGALALEAGDTPSGHAFVIRTGHAELIDGGRVIDVLGPGDMFGIPTMLTDLPPGLDVRASEDLLIYRIGAAAMLPLLAGRAGLRFLGATVRSRSAARRAERALTGGGSTILVEVARPTVTVDPSTTLVQVVRQMHERDASAVLVQCKDGSTGIVTDNDLRNRVLAVGRDLTDPVSAVMTCPARTVPSSATTEDAILLMLTHGIRHLPVAAPDGTMVGVVEEVDLLASEARTPLRLRRAIARAPSHDDLTQISTRLLESLVGAHEGGVSSDRACESYSVLVTSLLTRILELELAERGQPPVRFAFLATGSLARREMVPSSDLDTLMVWAGPDHDVAIAAWMRGLADSILTRMAACGFASDTNGARADDPRFSRSADAWVEAIGGWSTEPGENQGDIYLSALMDARPVVDEQLWSSVRSALDRALLKPRVLRLLSRVATARQPPTGFVRDLVIEAGGEHRGTVDIKSGGVGLAVELARLLAAVDGSAALGTADRLAATGSDLLLSHDDIDDLREAFLQLQSVRLEHQLAQVLAGAPPDDRLAPRELPGLSRRYLRDALRVVARLQRQVDSNAARWRP